MVYLYLVWIVIATIIGGFIPLLYKNIPAALLVCLYAFTGTFLLGITLGDLMPEVFKGIGSAAGIMIIFGFFTQYAIQALFPGVEHGTGLGKTSTTNLGFPALLAGLSVHAFTGGIPLGLAYTEPAILQSLAMAILVHKLPESLTLMLLISDRKSKRGRNILILCLFALMTPSGTFLAIAIHKEFLLNLQFINYIMAFVIGAFLQISTVILSKADDALHHLKKEKSIAVSLGLMFVIITLWVS